MTERVVALDMSFAQAFDVRNPDAYERLLLDVVRANQTIDRCSMEMVEADRVTVWPTAPVRKSPRRPASAEKIVSSRALSNR